MKIIKWLAIIIIIFIIGYFGLDYMRNHSVCGTDTKTYENMYALNHQGVSALYIGNCVYSGVATGSVQPLVEKNFAYTIVARLVQWTTKSETLVGAQ